MYHFVSGFINVTDLLVDVARQVPRYAPPCLSVTSSLHLILLLFIL